MRLFRLTALAAVLLALPLFAGRHAGRRAPGFALPDVTLKYHDLYDYRGKVVLIDIMQTTCPACQTFTRVTEKIKAKYGDKVAILSIVTAPKDNLDTVKRFIAAYKVTTPILFDCGQASASYVQVTPQNPTVHLPHLFVVNQQGMIHNDYEHGESTKEIFEGDGFALMREIDALLGGAKPAVKK
jgi:peroxiredoxin